MFSGLSELKILETDDPRLCCPYFFLYGDETMDCRTPIDELSSCNDLLRSDFFRGFLWTLSAMAISGNIGVLIYRVFLETQGSSSGFRVLVANLCVADFLMGVYWSSSARQTLTTAGSTSGNESHGPGVTCANSGLSGAVVQ
nr:hypothetical protein BaRGS_002471 [Batillaria attramentaria]